MYDIFKSTISVARKYIVEVIMKKLLVTLMCVAMVLTLMPAVAFAGTTSVGNAADLKNAISFAADGDVIILTSDIDLGSDSISINKAITITGGTDKYAIKSTAADVIKVLDTTMSLDGKVVLDNLTIKAANSSKTSRAIGLGGSKITKLELDVNNCVIETTQRGITVNADANTGIVLNVNNSSISLTNDITNYDEQVDPTDNYNNSRGISLWEMGESEVNIINSLIQGFYYSVNISGSNSSEGTVVSMANSTFKGRAAINSWAAGVKWTVTDCEIHGINNFGGPQEGFGTIVLNETSANNTVEVNNSKFTTYFNSTGLNNPNATEFMFAIRNSSSNAIIKGANTSYSCVADKGGIAKHYSTDQVKIYGGTFSCDASDYVAEGYGCYLKDGKYVVAPKATDIKLDKAEANIEVGQTITLKATVLPEGTLDTVAWATDKADVATVKDGVVTAVAPGTATITATVNGKTATCKVTVHKATVPKTDDSANMMLWLVLVAIAGVGAVAFKKKED